MSTIKFIIAMSLFFCQLTKADAFAPEVLEKTIKENNLEAIKEFLKSHRLSNQEKKFLLEYAHQNALLKKTKADTFTHYVGLKRKCTGLILTVTSITKFPRIRWLCLLGGLSMYQWGAKAAHKKDVRGKAEKIKKYETALSIEQLIAQATAVNDIPDSNSDK